MEFRTRGRSRQGKCAGLPRSLRNVLQLLCGLPNLRLVFTEWGLAVQRVFRRVYLPAVRWISLVLRIFLLSGGKLRVPTVCARSEPPLLKSNRKHGFKPGYAANRWAVPLTNPRPGIQWCLPRPDTCGTDRWWRGRHEYRCCYSERFDQQRFRSSQRWWWWRCSPSRKRWRGRRPPTVVAGTITTGINSQTNT